MKTAEEVIEYIKSGKTALVIPFGTSGEYSARTAQKAIGYISWVVSPETDKRAARIKELEAEIAKLKAEAKGVRC